MPHLTCIHLFEYKLLVMARNNASRTMQDTNVRYMYSDKCCYLVIIWFINYIVRTHRGYINMSRYTNHVVLYLVTLSLFKQHSKKT